MNTTADMEVEMRARSEDVKPTIKTQDNQMTSSTVSSLASPVDSGVQLLDSESEITSVMSVSGFGCDDATSSDSTSQGKTSDQKVLVPDVCGKQSKENSLFNREKSLESLLTKSDIANQNVTHDFSNLSMSVPNYFDKFDLTSNFSHSFDCKTENEEGNEEVFEMEHPIQGKMQEDIMNVSLNSYELLDYTLQNLNIPTDQMHVSLSEEVNETLKVALNNSEAVPSPVLEGPEEIPVVAPENKPVEEQIVFRRQRKKKSKSDTPKKRVSFHEDILNSTKIDDIHINHGFVTIEPDVSLSFFQRGFIKKPDVVKGRYSWAAEGDAPYYEKPSSDRNTKSDIYIQNKRFSSTSSSSTGSISSSIDEEDNSDENVKKEPNMNKQPKSSCLKKTKNKKFIDTKIVQEETNLKKKRSESNLLDTNIFGSLKNILNFSTSVPLAERGVPEGQEDVTVYSSSHDLSDRRRSFGNLSLKNFETISIKPAQVEQKANPKNCLKLTKSEGFYPQYPSNSNLPANIILCDSNVYEHKGISYSYEYDKFQKSFEREAKPKSSTVYQMILKEFNFFKRKAKEEPEKNLEDDFEFIQHASTPVKESDSCEKIEEVEEPDFKTCSTKSSKYCSSTRLDWSDNETISDMLEGQSSRHLHSPKRRINKNNHYQVQSSFKNFSDIKMNEEGEYGSLRNLQSLKPSSSKSSLINRFLRNVTLKKMLDIKAQNKPKTVKRYMSLYIKGVKPDLVKNAEVDSELDREVFLGREKMVKDEGCDKKLAFQIRKEILRNRPEKLIKAFSVRSAYTTKGESKPLLVVLTDATIYIAGMKPNNSYCNHFVLPYTELNTILIGPNAQTVHLSNYDKDMQCIFTTGCSMVTADLVGKLEMAMRRDVNKPMLPAVKQLSMRDMVNLRRAICKQTSVDKDEEYFYYSIVNIQDFVAENPSSTPLGPAKEGPLMFKTADSDSRWETAYFILKAGVLYMLSSASQRLPMRVFPLINGSCQGARRIFNSHRPHTFQLIVEGKSLLLAAPDEYVASEWLQELVHAASGTYNHREKNLALSCSLLMTSDHILTVREAFPLTVTSLLPLKGQHDPIKGAQALSCASIIDLTSFRLPSAEQSWCILEFACREVHECSGDWILYFVTNAELERFISTLEMLWAYNNESGESFPLSTIPETDPLSKRCVDVYTSLLGTWPTNTVYLQFL